MSLSTNFPTIKPTLLLDFANTKQLDPRITFSRASTATYYDGKTTAKAEENLLSSSQEFDNATFWNNPTRITISANSTAAPDGTTTADTLVETATTGSHFLGSATFPFVSGSQYVFSVFAKNTSSGRGFINLIAFGPFAAGSYAQFNLSTGAVGTTSGMTASIVDVGNGWYRCIAIATATSSASERFYAVLSDGTAAQLPSYAGDITKGIYLWGAQLEQRSSVTAYTATTTAPITNYIPALQTAASGVARFDHAPAANPTTSVSAGESLGLLIEEQRTNLLTYSDQFDNAAWVKFNATITANTVVAPDGTLTGDKLVEDSTTNIHYILSPSVSLTLGTAYTQSIYAKAAGKDWIRLIFSASAFGSSLTVFFNVRTGVVGSTSAGITASIQSVGNGWYRCVATATATATASAAVNCVLASSDGNVNYTGDGFSGAFIWGFQLEAGAFATSYIPTTSAQVTRSADAASMTGTNFSSWFRSDAGSMYTEFELYATTSASGMVVSGADSGSSNGYSLYKSTSTATMYAYEGSTNANLGSIIAGTFAKAALVYDSAGVAGSLNAAAVVSASASYPVTPTQFSLGKNWGGNQMSGHIKKFAYYPARVTNAQLQALTS